MKLLVVVLLFYAAFVANSTPLQRQKRSTFAMTGGYPFGGFGGGAFAGAGFGWPFAYSPWDYPRAYFPMPFPFFTIPKPWYEGDNVCTTTKEIQDPKELQEFFADTTTSGIDYSHESEQCQGTLTKYVCFKRYVSNGQSKMQATKYECCHGFVRNQAGPGCVESSAANNQYPGAIEYYNVKNQASSTSISSPKTGVDKVPIQ